MQPRVVLSVQFDPALPDHAAVLRWLEQQENKSVAIREALVRHIRGGLTLGDIYDELRRLRIDVAAGHVLLRSEAEPSVTNEDEDLKRALDSLGM
jgi:hypothetical protein